MSWVKGVGAITLFVDDLAGTAAFYRDVFGVPVVHQDDDSVAFAFASTVVNLLDVAAAPELVDPAPVGTSGSAPRAVLTVDVDDVDEVCAHLAEHGAELLNGPLDRPWGIRTASFRDPAGHVWEVAH